MSQFATDSDLLDYEPQIKEFGIQEFSDLHEKTYNDIIRLLNIRWWPTTRYGRLDISVLQGSSTKLDETKLDDTQFVRAAVYHVLSHYIYPKLSTFDPAGDVFREKMSYYKSKFEEEFNLILEVGVSYDLDNSGTFSDSEKKPYYHRRLQR
jgi:hypothetical protein